MSDREQRLARNEALFRAVNEEMAALDEESGGQPGPREIVCECSRVRCIERIEVSHGDFEWVRQDPRRFVVVPAHVDSEVERVVREEAAWVAVEKLGDAAEVAAETDPRT